MTTLPPAYIKRWLDYAKSLKAREEEQGVKLFAVPNPDEIYLEQGEYIDLIMQMNANNCVRELHQPVETRQYRKNKEVMLVGCLECMETGSGGEYFVAYPCPTIKALDGEKK